MAGIEAAQAAREALRRHFGYGSFRPGQEGVVSAILSGRDALAGLTLVISPLVSLMGD